MILYKLVFGIGLLIILLIIITVKIIHIYNAFYKVISTNYTFLNKSDNKKYSQKRLFK